MKPICKCQSCVQSEALKDDFHLPYRYIANGGHNFFHLFLHFSIPVIGAFLIGASWWALIPFAAFVVTYLVNSFWFCPSCPYHHEDKGLCGCFPKSVFKYNNNKPWGHVENITGWPIIIILLICPTLVSLYFLGNMSAFFFFITYFILGLVTHSFVSCPGCRQRGICYLGKSIVFLKKLKH
jgi:hypothetical protein